MFRRSVRAFSLIELMIVVTVIAILAAIAMVNYNRYGFRTRRADGREMLLRVAAAEERYFTNFNAYTADLTDAPTAGGLGFTDGNSERGFYVITATVANGGANFTLTATPQAGQVGDTCGNLSINDTEVKLPAGTGSGNNGNCW
jgi:type IV pilus assembly protein PilE